jgi:hypothetical protein
MSENRVEEVDIKELVTHVLDEEEISREDVSLLQEREARDYLEGLKKFIESDKNILMPLTSVAMYKVILLFLLLVSSLYT